MSNPSLAFGRRQLLGISLGAGLSALRLPVLAQEIPARTDALASLGAALDCLLPADEFSPCATALGVDREVRDFLKENELLWRLVAAGLAWLDHQDERPFHALPPERQRMILDGARAWDANQIPGRCYHILRALAVEFYFAHPETITELPLNPAPQPAGYPPPW